MKFEFIPSKNPECLNEFQGYLASISPYGKLLVSLYKIPLFVILFLIMTLLMSKLNFGFIASFIIVFTCILFSLLLIRIFSKLINKRKTSKVSLALYSDIDIISYYTIENNYLLKENDFSTIKVDIDKISEITILKNSLVLNTENNAITFFIPKYALPISENEFIDIFTLNSNITITDLSLSSKKPLKRNLIIVLIICVLATICSLFINTINFKKYDLVLANELSVTNNTSVYEGKNLKIKIFFPESWENHYGIEEVDNEINVYYLPNGKQSKKTTLLFNVKNIFTLDNTDTLYLNRFAGDLSNPFTIFTPKKILNLTEGSKESGEYLRMFDDIQHLTIQ